jgi:excisionase family DNA binding protein
MDAEPELMTTNEVAALLKVTPATVMNWAKSGELRGLKLNHRGWRFYRKDVLDVLKEQAS